MKILVTGGAGFIGSNFVRMVLDEYPDCDVINLDNLTYAGNLENLTGYIENDRHVFIKEDISDGQAVLNILAEHKPDALINFAAESHVDRSLVDPGAFIDTNITGTLNLLKGAVQEGTKKFVQISTDEVYGSLLPDGPAFNENTTIKPNSPYSASKAAADHMVHAFGHTWGLNYNITRCSNNYGPFQFPEKMIPLMINNAINEKELPVYGDGMQIRDWLYVYDHCTAIWKVLTEAQSGEIYNIGGSNEKTNIEVVNIILSKLGKSTDLIRHVTDRPGHDRRYAIDSSKIQNELDWAPSVSFEQGIEQTINWYLENDQWLNNVVSGQYQQYYQQMYDGR